MEWDETTHAYRLSTGTVVTDENTPKGGSYRRLIRGQILRGEDLTDAERQELADYMSSVWQKWARQEHS